jgi:ketosteroid isomerase-like protein
MSIRDQQSDNDAAALRQIFENWAKAVRDEDFPGIRANHDPNILMFDVPPPFLSRGLDPYMATWDTFYKGQARPVVFDFDELEVTAGSDVAFATTIGRCVYIDRAGEKTNLRFRLTMGFRKRAGQWFVVHEHHSIPAIE